MGTEKRVFHSLLGFRGLPLEDEIDRYGLVPRDSDFLGLSAKGFVPSRDRILARRQVVEREGAVVSGHRIMRRLQDREVGVHPRMDVAFDRDKLWPGK